MDEEHWLTLNVKRQTLLSEVSQMLCGQCNFRIGYFIPRTLHNPFLKSLFCGNKTTSIAVFNAFSVMFSVDLFFVHCLCNSFNFPY